MSFYFWLSLSSSPLQGARCCSACWKKDGWSCTATVLQKTCCMVQLVSLKALRVCLKQLSSQPARQQIVSFCPVFIFFSNFRKRNKHLLFHYTLFSLIFFPHFPTFIQVTEPHPKSHRTVELCLPSPLHFVLHGGEKRQCHSFQHCFQRTIKTKASCHYLNLMSWEECITVSYPGWICNGICWLANRKCTQSTSSLPNFL